LRLASQLMRQWVKGVEHSVSDSIFCEKHQSNESAMRFSQHVSIIQTGQDPEGRYVDLTPDFTLFSEVP
jgi:hypothetical protein